MATTSSSSNPVYERTNLLPNRNDTAFRIQEKFTICYSLRSSSLFRTYTCSAVALLFDRSFYDYDPIKAQYTQSSNLSIFPIFLYGTVVGGSRADRELVACQVYDHQPLPIFAVPAPFHAGGTCACSVPSPVPTIL